VHHTPSIDAETAEMKGVLAVVRPIRSRSVSGGEPRRSVSEAGIPPSSEGAEGKVKSCPGPADTPGQGGTKMLSSQARVLGEFLVERHVLSRDDLAIAMAESRRTGEALPAVLRAEGLVSEKDLTAAIAETVGVRFVDFTETPLHPDAALTVPEAVAREFQAIGVDFDGARLVVAFPDPGDDAAVQAVGQATGYEVVPAAAGRYEIQHAIDSVFGPAVPSLGHEAHPSSGGGDVHPVEDEVEGIHVNDLLKAVLEQRGSDLHLTAGSPPVIRVHGELHPVEGIDSLSGSQIREMIYAILTQKQREKFENELELDCSYSLPGRSRFRVNVFLQRDNVGAVMRTIPYEIVPFDDLGVPEIVRSFADLPRGLVLVTGPTGSGKSTTLASLIDIVNREKAVHIMTVEDPIEFLHQHKRAVVNQREVGEDTKSFAEALRHVLRQDPDVILVGEMRDLETIQTALTAAETGHLVFATLHTQDAPQSIDRVIDVFPAHQQQQVRVQLAASLQGICTQQLLQTPDGAGRALAAEVLVATPAVRNLIREGKIYQIYSLMQTGAKFGMITMDQHLAQMVRTHKVTMEAALERCASEEDLRRLTQAGAGDSGWDAVG
jgi:twitching motility protein PilT